jgi:hypothetical protein
MRAARSTPERMRSSYPTTVAGNSTGHLLRFTRCPRSQRLLIAKRRFGSTAGSGAGQDVLRVIGLGAKGTMIGRAFLYGLGAMGEAGVRLCLKIIAKELSVTMGLCGAVDINAVNSSVLIAPALIPDMTYGADIAWGPRSGT